jgi:hypothetical protein
VREPALRRRLARLGGPELGTGVLGRLMRELNPHRHRRQPLEHRRLRDLLTVQTARYSAPRLARPRARTHPNSTIPFRLQKFNEP